MRKNNARMKYLEYQLFNSDSSCGYISDKEATILMAKEISDSLTKIREERETYKSKIYANNQNYLILKNI